MTINDRTAHEPLIRSNGHLSESASSAQPRPSLAPRPRAVPPGPPSLQRQVNRQLHEMDETAEVARRAITLIGSLNRAVALEVADMLREMYRYEQLCEHLTPAEQELFALWRLEILEVARAIAGTTGLRLVEAVQALPEPAQRLTALDRVVNFMNGH